MADEKQRRIDADGERRSAAALTYEVREDVAPRVVAKGKGIIADKIIELAEEHGVPLHKDKTLVNLLLKLDLGDHIPQELYQAVAEVLVFIYKIERLAKKGLP